VRPVGSEDGGELPDLIFAVSDSEFGTKTNDNAGRPRYQDIGLDLDHTCTGEGEGPSCKEPPWANADHHDGVDGIDNSAGQWAADALPGGPDSTTATATVAEMMFRVHGYSGRADDDQVEVSLYVALGLAPREDGGVGPFWDGYDRWRILPEMLVPPGDGGTPSVDQPQFRDDQAYVSGGVLVAKFDGALWPAGLDRAPTWLTKVEQVVIAGHLARVGDTWELQNLVTGVRIRLPDALIAAARFPIALGADQYVCQLPTAYDGLRQQLCRYLDIASGPDSPSSVCDAASGGSLLQAKPALFGDVRPPSPATLPPCDPSVHPETDTCDSPADN
jgi:hypothetical protein